MTDCVCGHEPAEHHPDSPHDCLVAGEGIEWVDGAMEPVLIECECDAFVEAGS